MKRILLILGIGILTLVAVVSVLAMVAGLLKWVLVVGVLAAAGFGLFRLMRSGASAPSPG